MYTLNWTINGNLTVGASGSINTDAKGYVMNQGPGTGGVASNNAAGASYGGSGGPVPGVASTPTYGSITAPTLMGSGGGANNNSGGTGGGAIQLTVTGTTTVLGIISSNGSNATGPCCSGNGGGGSGGAVYIITYGLAGSGVVSATGGNGEGWDDVWGGGSGGRIAVHYTSASSNITYNNYGGNNYDGTFAGAGTTYLKSASQTYGNLILDNNNKGGSNELIFGRTPLATFTMDSLTIRNSASMYLIASSATATSLTLSGNGHYEVKSQTTLNYSTLDWSSGILTDSDGVLAVLTQNQDLTIPTSSKLIFNVLNGTRTYNNLTVNGLLSHSYNTTATTGSASLYKINWTINGNLTVGPSGSINTDARGYVQNQGPGTGTVSGANSAGASYGGLGGAPSGTAAGPIYGSTSSPVDLGSGGASTNGAGGSGGGAVILTVSGTSTINGTITANASAGSGPCCSNSGSGGSGGSIYITTQSFGGAGSLSANGANGGSWNASWGSGGGGRIAIRAAAITSNVSRSVNGGSNGVPGGVGTLYPDVTAYLTTDPATNVTDVSATLNGAVSDPFPYYGNNISQHGFVWGTSTNPSLATNTGFTQLGSKTATGTFSSNIIGLTGFTTYHVRSYATTPGGTTYGNDVTFTTGAAQVLNQSTYRFYENVDALQPAVALGGENAAITLSTSTHLQPIRLRLNVAVTVQNAATSTLSFKLQVSTSTTDGWQLVGQAGQSWYDRSFSRRLPVNIYNTSVYNLTDFQVSVPVTYDSEMRSDFGDVRFADASGTPISYWRETFTTSTRAVFWVKLPSFPSFATTTIYMYFGNAATTTGGNIGTVFIFGDDFTASTSIDTTKWNIVNGTGFSIVNGKLHGTNTTGRLASLATFNSGIVLEVKNITNTEANNGHVIGGFRLSTSNGIGYLNHPSQDFYRNDGSWIQINNFSNGTTSLLRLAVKSPTLVDLTISNYDDQTVVYNSVLNISNSVTAEPIVLGERYDDANTGQTYNSDWSWIRVRKYVNSDPTVAFGSKEEIFDPYWKFYNNPSVTDGAGIGGLLLSTSNVQETYQEGNNTAFNPNAILIGQTGEWDFALDPSSIPSGIAYYFRLVRSDGTVFGTYTNYPQVTYVSGYGNNPNTPSNLGPASVVNGSLLRNGTPSFTFNITDPDATDHVKYRIQIADNNLFNTPLVDYTSATSSQGAMSFTVGQATGTGVYTSGYYGQVLPI